MRHACELQQRTAAELLQRAAAELLQRAAAAVLLKMSTNIFFFFASSFCQRPPQIIYSRNSIPASPRIKIKNTH